MIKEVPDLGETQRFAESIFKKKKGEKEKKRSSENQEELSNYMAMV